MKNTVDIFMDRYEKKLRESNSKSYVKDAISYIHDIISALDYIDMNQVGYLSDDTNFHSNIRYLKKPLYDGLSNSEEFISTCADNESIIGLFLALKENFDNFKDKWEKFINKYPQIGVPGPNYGPDNGDDVVDWPIGNIDIAIDSFYDRYDYVDKHSDLETHEFSESRKVNKYKNSLRESVIAGPNGFTYSSDAQLNKANMVDAFLKKYIK